MVIDLSDSLTRQFDPTMVDNSDKWVAHEGAIGFKPTRWSMVIAAVHQSPEALAIFCRDYWYPVYAHLRRRGLSPEDSEDRTQAVFARLTQPDALQNVSAEHGRFRTFVLACAENEVGRWRKGMAAQKRGSGTRHESLDQPEAESLFSLEAASAEDPMKAYDRSYALALLRRVMESMEREYRRTHQSELFDVLRPWLTDPPDHGDLVRVAGFLGTNEGSLRVSWHRLRHRFANALMEEVSQTVADPEDARDELRHLLSVLATAPVG